MKYRKALLQGFKSSSLSLAIAVALAAPAVGQTVGDTPALEEIMITGSRIQRNSMTTPTPVTAMSADDLQNMAPGNLIEAFNQVPQFLNNESTQTASNYAGAAGASNLNLRGIGPNRTLVLLNGRRVVSASRRGTVDINLFPESMIERVEVVTGGASAAYGSDAVAGVANFILDTDFEGFKANVQTGETSRGDAKNNEVSLSFGTSLGDRAHFIGSLDHFVQDGVDNYAGRDWYEAWGQVTNPAYTASGGTVGPRLLVAPNVVSTEYTFGGLINAPGSALNRLMFLPDGSAVPFIASDISAIGTGTNSQSTFNGGSGDNVEADRGGQGGLVSELDRNSAFAHFTYDLTNNTSLYAQAIYGRARTNGVGNSPVLFGPSYGATIFSGNPYLPASVQAIMDAEGLQSFGFNRMHSSADLAQGRLEQSNTTTSYTIGFDSEIQDGWLAGWQVNGYFQKGKNRNALDLMEFIRVDRLAMAMDAVIDPRTGAVTCNATLAGHPRYQDCVPVNLFGEGNVTRQAMDYLLGPDKNIRAEIEQDFAELSMNGEIWQGWGAGPISGAFGISHREESIDQRVGPDDLLAMSVPVNDPSIGLRGIPRLFAGDGEVHQFSSIAEIRGSYKVKEAFAETLVPLIADVTGIEQMDLSLAARWADYSGSGGIWSYKAGIDWQVYGDLRLRGTWSRDVRAANLSERFDAQGQGATGEDPLFGREMFTFAQTIGGNPNVAPEEADTLTFGLVYQPSWLDGLNLAVDYYQIEIDGAIGQLGVQRIIDDCFNGAAEICAQILRDPATNQIVNVSNVFLNINQAAVSGIDWEATYSMDVDWFGDDFETLNFRLLGSWLEENSTTNLGAATVDRAGDVGTMGLPEFRWNASVNYRNGPISIFLQERYTGEGNLDNDFVEGIDINDNSVEAAWYTDMRVAYEVETANTGVFEVFGNVTNLFDRDPPVAATFSAFAGAGQVNRSLHDVLGRRYTLGFRYSY